jgi:hypothetical protein
LVADINALVSSPKAQLPSCPLKDCFTPVKTEEQVIAEDIAAVPISKVGDSRPFVSEEKPPWIAIDDREDQGPQLGSPTHRIAIVEDPQAKTDDSPSQKQHVSAGKKTNRQRSRSMSSALPVFPQEVDHTPSASTTTPTEDADKANIPLTPPSQPHQPQPSRIPPPLPPTPPSNELFQRLTSPESSQSGRSLKRRSSHCQRKKTHAKSSSDMLHIPGDESDVVPSIPSPPKGKLSHHHHSIDISRQTGHSSGHDSSTVSFRSVTQQDNAVIAARRAYEKDPSQ